MKNILLKDLSYVLPMSRYKSLLIRSQLKLFGMLIWSLISWPISFQCHMFCVLWKDWSLIRQTHFRTWLTYIAFAFQAQLIHNLDASMHWAYSFFSSHFQPSSALALCWVNSISSISMSYMMTLILLLPLTIQRSLEAKYVHWAKVSMFLKWRYYTRILL